MFWWLRPTLANTLDKQQLRMHLVNYKTATEFNAGILSSGY
jgi:hypothetical protein